MIEVNKLITLKNQVWRYIVTSNLIDHIKQLVNFNNLLTVTIVYITGPWCIINGYLKQFLYVSLDSAESGD